MNAEREVHTEGSGDAAGMSECRPLPVLRKYAADIAGKAVSKDPSYRTEDLFIQRR